MSTLLAVILVVACAGAMGLLISKWSREKAKSLADGRLSSPDEHSRGIWDETEWRCEHGYKLSNKMRCTWPAYHAEGCPPPKFPDKKFHFGDPGDPEPIRS